MEDNFLTDELNIKNITINILDFIGLNEADLYRCNLCRKVPLKPYQCYKCETIYCNNCFEKDFIRPDHHTTLCSKCCCLITDKTELKKNLLSKLEELTLECINPNCYEEVKFGSYFEHYAICPYTPRVISCSSCSHRVKTFNHSMNLNDHKCSNKKKEVEKVSNNMFNICQMCGLTFYGKSHGMELCIKEIKYTFGLKENEYKRTIDDLNSQVVALKSQDRVSSFPNYIGSGGGYNANLNNNIGNFNGNCQQCEGLVIENQLLLNDLQQANDINTTLQRDLNELKKDIEFNNMDPSSESAFKLKCLLSGHIDAITCLLVTKDDIIISGSCDRSIKFWQLVSSEYVCMKTLDGHKGGISTLFLLSNGNLASASHTMIL
jgi:hypothetical protein